MKRVAIAMIIGVSIAQGACSMSHDVPELPEPDVEVKPVECRADDDCDAGAALAVCDVGTCQGSRATLQCRNGMCEQTGTRADDSNCGKSMRALECGAYADVYCNGAEDQAVPACPTFCAISASCDPSAVCWRGTCIASGSVADGQTCTSSSECESDHCQNGFCCQEGDCCTAASDCPMLYSSEPTCDSAATCQGTRGVAACIANVCASEIVADDSACGAGVVARVCLDADAVMCTGAREQPATPECPPAPAEVETVGTVTPEPAMQMAEPTVEARPAAAENQQESDSQGGTPSNEDSDSESDDSAAQEQPAAPEAEQATATATATARGGGGGGGGEAQNGNANDEAATSEAQNGNASDEAATSEAQNGQAE